MCARGGWRFCGIPRRATQPTRSFEGQSDVEELARFRWEHAILLHGSEWQSFSDVTGKSRRTSRIKTDKQALIDRFADSPKVRNKVPLQFLADGPGDYKSAFSWSKCLAVLSCG